MKSGRWNKVARENGAEGRKGLADWGEKPDGGIRA